MRSRKDNPRGNLPQISSLQIRRLADTVRKRGPPAVRAFWDRMAREGTPLIEKRRGSPRDYWVTFLWRGRPGTRNVGLRSNLAGRVASESELARLPGTDVWFRTYPVRDDLRDTYQFAVNEPLRPARNPLEQARWEKRRVADPLNPKVIKYPRDPKHPNDPLLDVKARLSLVELPRAPRHREGSPQPGVEAGRLEEHVFHSRILKDERRIWVHLPVGLERNRPDLDVAVFFDGFFYSRMMPGPTILDNLLASRRIAPVLSVFIEQLWTAKERSRDLCELSPAFGRFLIQELLPWVKRTYRVRLRPERTMLVGASCGGLSALHWAAEHPKHFRLVLSQSGSFQIMRPPDEVPGSLIRAMMARPKLPLRIYMDVGLLEGNYVHPRGMPLLAANRHMRDVLVLKGYPVSYQEFNGGHDFECWRETLVDGLVELLGTGR